MKRTISQILYILVSISVVFICGCNDNDDPENKPEFITTVRLTFQEFSGGAHVGDLLVYTWKDIDGSAAGIPLSDQISLSAGKTYHMNVEVLSEVNSAIVNLTEEITNEADVHQFFFVRGSDLQITVTYGDSDGHGHPIGLHNVVHTGVASTGTLTVILRHEPDKHGSGVSDGVVTNAGGDTDIDATFNVSVM